MNQISIIVPIYNAERYLKECIDSIMAQTYTDWELILVDDGSVDHSPDICRMYADRDSRIKAVHRENGGEAAARKTGLEVSTGDLIAFVDSDDWLAPGTIETLYREMTACDADVVISGYTEVRGNQEKIILNKLEPGVYRGRELEDRLFSKMLCCADYFELGLWPYFWNKLFKREVLAPCLERLNEKLVVGVDAVCVFPALLAARTICVIPDASYHYRIHPASIMHRFRREEEEVENIRLQYREMGRYFARNKYYDRMKPQLERYIRHHLLVRAAAFLNRNMRERGLSLLDGTGGGNRVVIYGAGAFGTSLMDLYQQSKDAVVAAWCDTNYQEKQQMGSPVVSVDEALQAGFDTVVIAVLNQNVKDQIRESLIVKGIREEQIRWLNGKDLEEMSLSGLFGEERTIFVGYGVGYYYSAVGSRVKEKLKLSYLCDRKWDHTNEEFYDGIPVISMDEMSKLGNVKAVIFSCEDAIKKSIADDLKRNGIAYMFADDVLDRRILTGKEIRQEGKNGLWEDGNHNRILYDESLPDEIRIFFRGERNRLSFGSGLLTKNLFVEFGNDGELEIGTNVRIAEAQFHIAYGAIRIGDDCLFSSQVILRTHDGHHIFDRDTHERLNRSGDIIIEKHVWIAEGVSLFAGAQIGSGSVVGARAVTSARFGDHVILAGVPARVIRENICWSRDNTQFSDYSLLEECAVLEDLKQDGRGDW